MLEDRHEQFVISVTDCEGVDAKIAATTLDAAIDRWVWYAGWSDKVAQVVGSSNPVAGPYFDFSIPEPTGVVGVLAPQRSSLLGLVSVLAPVLTTGNTAVVVASDERPIPAMTLAEVLATSDLPGGVVNILTGRCAELAPVLAAHRRRQRPRPRRRSRWSLRRARARRGDEREAHRPPRWRGARLVGTTIAAAHALFRRDKDGLAPGRRLVQRTSDIGAKWPYTSSNTRSPRPSSHHCAQGDAAAPFRILAKRVAIVLCLEATRNVETERVEVDTPIARTVGSRIAPGFVAVPILRAGLGMLEAVTELFPEVLVGYIGLER